MKREKTARHWDVRNHGVEMAQSIEQADASGNCEADPHPLISEETRHRIRHCEGELNNWKGETFTLRPLPTENRVETQEDERYYCKQQQPRAHHR